MKKPSLVRLPKKNLKEAKSMIANFRRRLGEIRKRLEEIKLEDIKRRIIT